MVSLQAGHGVAARAERAHGAAAEEWSRIWFNLLGREWRSLALVPAAPGVPALPVAERLLDCAHAYQSGAVRLVDAQGALPGDVAAFDALVADHVAARERVLVVLSSPLAHASAIPLARAADAALLVVPLGEAGVRESRRTVAAVGHARFAGSLTVRGA
jgi:hypothetical protein